MKGKDWNICTLNGFWVAADGILVFKSCFCHRLNFHVLEQGRSLPTLAAPRDVNKISCSTGSIASHEMPVAATDPTVER